MAIPQHTNLKSIKSEMRNYTSVSALYYAGSYISAAKNDQTLSQVKKLKIIQFL